MEKGFSFDGPLQFIQRLLSKERIEGINRADDEIYLANIRGYEEILESGDEANVLNFISIRGMAQPKFTDNERVIEHMKASGIWKVTDKDGKESKGH